MTDTTMPDNTASAPAPDPLAAIEATAGAAWAEGLRYGNLKSASRLLTGRALWEARKICLPEGRSEWYLGPASAGGAAHHRIGLDVKALDGPGDGRVVH